MNIAYLELTRFSDTSPQGFDDFPRFDKNIWPLLMQNASIVETVYVCKYPSIWQRLFSKGSARQEIIDIGALKMLSSNKIKEIKQLSNYGGHLDVFYKVKDEDFLCRLIQMWSSPGQIGKDINALGLDHAKKSNIENLVSNIATSYVLLSFGHDADPLYIIGASEVLSRLAGSR